MLMLCSILLGWIFQAAAAGFLGGQAVEVGLVDVPGLIDAVETGRIEGFDLRIECFDDGFQIAQILETMPSAPISRHSAALRPLAINSSRVGMSMPYTLG